MLPYIIIGIVALIVIIILVRCVRIVQQAKAYVIERLGAYKTTWNVGLHFKLPFIERVAKVVSLKEQVADFPPQPVITEDNVTMQIDTVVYLPDHRPQALHLRHRAAPSSPSRTSRPRRCETSSATSSWTSASPAATSSTPRCAPSSTRPPTPGASRSTAWSSRTSCRPREIQNAMEKQMKAERERREAILRAEGEKKSAILTAEGEKESAILRADAKKQAQILEAQGEAEAILTVQRATAEGIKLINESAPTDPVIKIKALEAFAAAADGRATKIIIPSEIQGLAGLAEGIVEAVKEPQKPEPKPAAK